MRPENDLVRGIRNRDPGIFEEFVRRYQSQVYFTALRMVGERDDALDVAQEVFLKIWRFAPKLKGDVALKTWVYRVAVNTCIDRLRERGRHADHTARNNLILLAVPDQQMSPHEHARMAEELNRLRNALNELTERQRSVFVLRHFQNLRTGEIAEILSTPEGTIKATLYQTLQKLRGLLGTPAREISDRDESEPKSDSEIAR
ncbi:MAG TPA: sigma-70 family RNA polymerase sigma factor [bacterium]|nr:sigma-70 family RNA polymerase sigma factor [bacterium]HQP99076.1 sigma-70 family RNA polymerase sigma factor [bacterium]